MSYAIGIVAHPLREQQAYELAELVGGLVNVDVSLQGEQWCHQRTLERLTKTDADWYILLEDDAIPCAHFREHLEQALDDAPAEIFSLYLGTGRWAGNASSASIGARTQLADIQSDTWIRANFLHHAVAVAIHNEHARPLLQHLRLMKAPTDQAIGRYAKHRNLTVAYTWPSHVNHADGPRLAGPDTTVERRAWRMCNQE